MKVLIAIENSRFIAKVTDAVVQHVWPEDAEFMILNAIDACSMPANVLTKCRELLEDEVTDLRNRLPHHTVTGEVTEGDARSDIIAIAEQWCADLIVIAANTEGPNKPHGVSTLVISVLNHAPCSVEVVKTPRRKQNRQDKNLVRDTSIV